MADDARFSTALPRHPKTVKLRRILGTEGCWSLVCLLLWVADNRPTGQLSSMVAEDIEIAADWGGEPSRLVRTLVEVGFLDEAQGEYSVHDWAEHNPWVVRRPERIEAARAAANKRWAKTASMQSVCEAHAPGNATRMRKAMPTPPPNPTQPDTPTESGAVETAINPDAADQRHTPTQRLIRDLHFQKFGLTCPWDGSEARPLHLVLSNNPAWTLDQLSKMVRNRFASDGVAPERARKWLPSLGNYAAGPLDRFNKLRESNGDGNKSRNQAQRRQDENIAAARDAISILHSRMAH